MEAAANERLRQATPPWKDYVLLTKPRLTLTALFTAACGYFMAAAGEGAFDRLGWTLLGAGLTGAAANALNQWMERKEDALMRRTAERPLPARRLRPGQALLFGIVLGLAGLATLLAGTGTLPFLAALATLVSYLAFYTPLKKKTAWNTYVGAFPGALPVFIGWSAAAGSVDARGAAFFLVLYCWQLPHFFSIAWVHRDDYRRAGFRMLTHDDPDGRITGRRMVAGSVALVAASFLPYAVGLAGLAYLFTAIFFGILLGGFAAAVHAGKLLYARHFLPASVLYLLVLLLSLLLDKVPQ